MRSPVRAWARASVAAAQVAEHRQRARVHRTHLQRCPSSRAAGGRSSRAAPVDPVLDVQPAEEDVARRLHQALPGDHPLAVVAEVAGADEALQHRLLRLLDLQHQRVVAVAAQQQGDPARGCRRCRRRPPCAPTSDQLELLNSSRRSWGSVAAYSSSTCSRLCASWSLLGGGQARRAGTISGGSRRRSAARRRPRSQLGERLQAVAARVLSTRRSAAGACFAPSLDAISRGPARRPPRGRTRRRGSASRRSAPSTRGTRPSPPARSAPGRAPPKPLSRPASSRLAASRLTSHSHGPGQRLVEVVDVEHQPPLGGGEQPEVRAGARPRSSWTRSPETRGAGQVGRHDQRRRPGRT